VEDFLRELAGSIATGTRYRDLQGEVWEVSVAGPGGLVVLQSRSEVRSLPLDSFLIGLELRVWVPHYYERMA
jgi:hypothetical protein